MSDNAMNSRTADDASAAAVRRPAGRRRHRKPGKALPPPKYSRSLLARIAPADIALFRFLLESYDHLAYFTVLEKDTAILRIVYSPHCEKSVRRALDDMAQTVSFTLAEWPFPPLDE